MESTTEELFVATSRSKAARAAEGRQQGQPVHDIHCIAAEKNGCQRSGRETARAAGERFLGQKEDNNRATGKRLPEQKEAGSS